MVAERAFRPLSGWIPLIVVLALFFLAGPALFVQGVQRVKADEAWAGLFVVAAIATELTAIIGLAGLMAIAPNDARVLLLFGEYKGSVRTSGFYWVNPFYSKRKITLRVRNFETGAFHTPEVKDAHGKVLQTRGRSSTKPSKVNDREGNPIEISAVVVWRVVDTAQALFEVEDYLDFVIVQCEAAIRHLSPRHPYDSEDHEVSLRGNADEVSGSSSTHQGRLDRAGIEVIEARIWHLAYAPEIAAAMLQRQAAGAISRRGKDRGGAVGMVEVALEQGAKNNILSSTTSGVRRWSNLLVVLCGHRPPSRW